MANNSSESGANHLPKTPAMLAFPQIPEPKDQTTETAEVSRPPTTETERLNAFFASPLMKNINFTQPPTPALTEAGEKAFQELGLSDPICPSIHLTPPWTQEYYIIPGTRKSAAKCALSCRQDAQRYARKADKWRYERDQVKLTLQTYKTKAGTADNDSEVTDETDEKKRKKKLRTLHRLAVRRIEWYERQSRARMTMAYVEALTALLYDA